MGAGRRGRGEVPLEVYAHKLFAPPLRPDALPRQAVLDRVFRDPAVRVVLLQGPTGHGKTTLLRQIHAACERRGARCGWLTLDAADNDARRFFLHVQALLVSLAGAGGDASSAPAALGADDADARRGRRSDWAIDRLQKARQPALFIDDFQTLENPRLLAFFRELCERVPPGTNLFIGSRSAPEIGLSRLLIDNRALLLRADDLRFSRAEVERFFVGARDGPAVSEDEIAAIYRRTEGWPAALQLFRFGLANPALRRSLDSLTDYRPRELAEYLTDNVLAVQEPAIRDFLLRTALLTRLNASLCNRVSGRSDAQEILLRLERAGLFLRSLDTDLHWFEYHGLFAACLAEQLGQQSAARVVEVHRLAAQWHLDQGDAEEALHHAVAAGDSAAAADILNACASRLVAGAYLVTVERWFKQLPLAEVARRPDLTIKVAYALAFLRRRQELKPLLGLLRDYPADADIGATLNPTVVLTIAAIAADDVATAFELAEGIPVNAPDSEGFARFELAAAANFLAYRALALGDFAGVRSNLALARTRNFRGDASLSRGYTFAIAGVDLLVQGQLGEALNCFRAGMAEQGLHADKSVASAALVACYLWALYEAGELDQVEALFGRYRDTIADAVLLDFLAVGYLSMARVHDARGRHDKALEVLDEAEAISRANGWSRFVATLDWERVRRALLAKDIVRAQAIAAMQPAPGDAGRDWVLFSQDIEDERLGRIRLAIRRREIDAAAAALAVEFARQPGRINRQIKLHLLDAQLQQARGASSAALRSLRAALGLAGPGGFLRCFIDEGEEVLQLLRESERDAAPAEREFIRRLLAAAGAETKPALDALTERERQILVFLANGVSNREMAGRIFVSENTVKFHLKNIYSKLAVSSRLQAVAAARQMGLIR